MTLASLIAALAGYLLGSIPTGFLAGKARGIDIRAQGSGNIGATNAFRILGKPLGATVLLVDILKGWAAVLIAMHGVPGWTKATPDPSQLEWLGVIGGFSAILGHNFTCWLRFRGGKGIATSGGVLLGLVPVAFLTGLGAFAVTLALLRFVSLGSLAAALALPITALATHKSGKLVFVTIAMAVLAFYKHIPNIQRLIKGTEPRVGQKAAGGKNQLQ